MQETLDSAASGRPGTEAPTFSGTGTDHLGDPFLWGRFWISLYLAATGGMLGGYLYYQAAETRSFVCCSWAAAGVVTLCCAAAGLLVTHRTLKRTLLTGLAPAFVAAACIRAVGMLTQLEACQWTVSPTAVFCPLNTGAVAVGCILAVLLPSVVYRFIRRTPAGQPPVRDVNSTDLLLALLFIAVASYTMRDFWSTLSYRARRTDYDQVQNLMRFGRWKTVEYIARSRLRGNPNDPYQLYYLGRALFGMGEYEKAEEAFRRILRKDPSWEKTVKPYIEACEREGHASASASSPPAPGKTVGR